MAIWGKLLGGVFGFVLGGPLGAVIGAAFGHNFDSGLERLAHDSDEDLSPGDAERVQMVFFTTTFSVMGYLAKVDGQVSKSEIKLAEDVMGQMSLTPELRDAAIKLFNQGKSPEFDLVPVLMQFRKECRRRSNLFRMFLEIQIQASLADGTMDSEEEAVLLQMSEILGFPEAVFRQLEMLVRVSLGMHPGSSGAGSSGSGGTGNRHGGRSIGTGKLSLNAAYTLLGVEKTDDKATVKRAYRRLMSQHHPDKLVSKGLPEEMIKLATEKTQQIQEAYEKVKEAKDWK